MLCEDSLNPAERRYVVRLDGDRFCPSLFEECCCRPTDFRISLLYRVLRTVGGGSNILANHIHRRQNDRVRIVNLLKKLHPPDFECVFYRWGPIGIGFRPLSRRWRYIYAPELGYKL